MNGRLYIILSDSNFDCFKVSTTKIFFDKKILPCVSLLVSYIIKKSNQVGKVNQFGKKAVPLKLYRTKYILLSCTKFNCFKRITTKILLSKRNSFALHFSYLFNEKGS